MLSLTGLLDLGSSCTFLRYFRNVESEMSQLVTIHPSWPSDLGLPTCRCPGLETTVISSSLPPSFELAWGTIQSPIGFAELCPMLHWFCESPLDRKLRLCIPIVHHVRVCTRLARSRWTWTVDLESKDCSLSLQTSIPPRLRNKISKISSFSSLFVQLCDLSCSHPHFQSTNWRNLGPFFQRLKMKEITWRHAFLWLRWTYSHL